MKRIVTVLFIISVVGLLVACGAPPAASPSVTPDLSTPTTPPTPTEEDRDLATPAPEIATEAVEWLADDLDIDHDSLEVVSVESVMWEDASLGCPEPGEMYAQVVTPGYRVVVRENGTEYEVHTDESGDTIVRCPSDETRGVDGDTGSATNGVEAVAANVRTELADALDIDADALELVSHEAVNWQDAALGCPEPDTSYAQVIVPGYELLYEGPDGTTYRVHTDEAGDNWVLCEDGNPVSFETTRGDVMVPTDVPAAAEQAYNKALQSAADAAGAERDALSLQSWERVTWNDASLGCPKEGMMYAQVVTPGYSFVFATDGATIEVHTNENGSSAVVCDTE